MRISDWSSDVCSSDLADACLFLMTLDDARYSTLLGSRDPDEFVPPLVNIGYGSDVTIRELAEMIATVIGYEGRLAFDPSKPDGTPRKLMDSGKIAALGCDRKSKRLNSSH